MHVLVYSVGASYVILALNLIGVVFKTKDYILFVYTWILLIASYYAYGLISWIPLLAAILLNVGIHYSANFQEKMIKESNRSRYKF
ncbi:hypothetical protein PPBDW_I21377 [Photobacterium kishitanii]|nr:hypothetical protein PPBDW_I21377 [Photobacterium kishitanii]